MHGLRTRYHNEIYGKGKGKVPSGICGIQSYSLPVPGILHGVARYSPLVKCQMVLDGSVLGAMDSEVKSVG